MKKLLKKFSTDIFDYEIWYGDYDTRYPGRYDGSVWFDRKMGDLKWSLAFDKILIDKVRNKFNLNQMTWNWGHNGFSANYVKRKDMKKIAKYLYNQLKYYYYVLAKEKRNGLEG
jgi:hypothetical protein